MEKKALLKLVVIILLSLSYVAYAVPQTRRSPMGRKVDPSPVLGHQAKEDLVMDLRNSEEMFNYMKEGLEEERMMMDVADYPGTGPNHKHDPKSPGKY